MDLKSTLPAPVRSSCPSCKAQVNVLLHGLSRFVACGGCGHGYIRDTSTGYLTERRQYRTRVAKPYLLPGDEGVLFDRRYLVTGWVRKKEKSTPYVWTEYHLFNPVNGFAQLSVYEGHWTFHEQLRIYPRETNINQILLFERNAYEPFNSYSCSVLEAEGEFTRDVNDDQQAKVSELVSPPFMLTRELEPDELAWYLGRYVEPKAVRQAFGKERDPEPRNGVGACQPMKLAIDVNVLRTITIIAVLLLLVTQLVISVTDPPRALLTETHTVMDGPDGRPLPMESSSFSLDRARSSVELFARAPEVDNNWFELSGALINNATGESRSFTFNIENYHGYEGGENWSEGGTKDGIVFSALPAGTYHLEMDAAYDAVRPVRRVEVRLEQHPTLWSNMWLLLLLALAFPLITWYRVSSFETNRWGE
jgi:hypothetical protein